jgi:hypothetical protein
MPKIAIPGMSKADEEQPVSALLLNPNAMRQQRYRERQNALRDAQSNASGSVSDKRDGTADDSGDNQ